jgi:hypothetical protein
VIAEPQEGQGDKPEANNEAQRRQAKENPKSVSLTPQTTVSSIPTTKTKVFSTPTTKSLMIQTHQMRLYTRQRRKALTHP